MSKKIVKIFNLIMAIFIIVMSSVLMIGCSQVADQELKSIFLDAVNSEQVKTIKDFQLDNGYRLGDLIDTGLAAPTYELFDPAVDGETYITISGNILYNNQEVVVGLQYKRINETNGNENYEFYTLVYNDLPQNALETVNFFNYLIENYEKKQVAETTEAAPVKIAESTHEQKTSSQTQSDFVPVTTVADWILYNTPADWNYSYDADWGIATLLDANGMYITIEEFYSDDSVDAICAAEGIDLSYYENIEVDLSSSYLAHYPPATYSDMVINELYGAFYVSSGGDGNMYTTIYIPEGDLLVKLTISENMWDANFTFEFEESVMLILDGILTSL